MFLIQIDVFRDQFFFVLLRATTGPFLGQMDRFQTQARFWPKQHSYQVWRESVKKCNFYGVYERLANLTRICMPRPGPWCQGHGKVTTRSKKKKNPQHWSMIIPNIKFVLQIASFRSINKILQQLKQTKNRKCKDLSDGRLWKLKSKSPWLTGVT